MKLQNGSSEERFQLIEKQVRLLTFDTLLRALRLSATKENTQRFREASSWTFLSNKPHMFGS
ncbi:MAG: hypothetical protein ABWY06_16925 [Pseudomonas sp.]|uniref:hypothetical protein n=1 Tax=Pseudomonas sp. TaxID=306 RepID=UPI003391AF17